LTDRSDSAALVERIEELDRIFAANPRTIEFITLADALLRADRYRQAYDVLRTGLRYRPDHVEARVLLGEALLRAGRLRAATREVAQVLKVDQQHIGAMLVLARALALDNRVDEARVILKRARSNAPSDARIALIRERLDDPEALQTVDLPSLLRDRTVPSYLSQSGADGVSTDISSTSDAMASVIIDRSYAWELAEMPDSKRKSNAVNQDGDTSIEGVELEKTAAIDMSVTQISEVTDDSQLERTVPISAPMPDAEKTIEISSPFESVAPTASNAEEDEVTLDVSGGLAKRPIESQPPKAVRPLVSPREPGLFPSAAQVQGRDTEPSVNDTSFNTEDAKANTAELDWESVLSGPEGLDSHEDGDTSQAVGLPIGLDLALRRRSEEQQSVADTAHVTPAQVGPRDTPKMGFGPASMPSRDAAREALEDSRPTQAQVTQTDDESSDDITSLAPALDGAASPPSIARRSLTVRGPLGGGRADSTGRPRTGGPSVPSSAAPPVSAPGRPGETPGSNVDQNWFEIHSQPPRAQESSFPVDPRPNAVKPRSAPPNRPSRRPDEASPNQDWLADDADALSNFDSPVDGRAPRRRPLDAEDEGELQAGLGRRVDLFDPSVTPRDAKGPPLGFPPPRNAPGSVPLRASHLENSTVDRPQTVPLPKRRRSPAGREASMPPPSNFRGELNTPTPASVRREPVVSGGPPPGRAPSKAPTPAKGLHREKSSAPPRLPRVSKTPRKGPPKLPSQGQIPPIPSAPPPRRGIKSSPPAPSTRTPHPAKDRNPHQRFDHVVETVAGQSLSEITPPPSPWGRVASLMILIATLILALVVTLRYRGVVTMLENEHLAASTKIADGNYIPRVEVAAALSVPIEEPGFLARLGDSSHRLLGRPGFSAAEEARQALLARLEAERVYLYGDRGRLETAQKLVAAGDGTPLLDHIIAAALLDLAGDDPGKAAQRLDLISEAERSEADVHWLRGLIADDRGDVQAALQHVERALQQDDRHPHAPTFRIDLKVKSGEHAVDALHDYQRLLTQDKPGHIGAQISLERLRIQVRKRPGEAVESLKRLLDAGIGRLSPTQRALVHDSIGLYYLQEVGDQAQARKAYTAARDAAPSDSRFVVGLARLDMQSFDLTGAEKALEKAIAVDGRNPLYKTMLAEIDLSRGNASGAVRRLSAIARRDASANLLMGRAHLARAESPLATEDTRKEAHALALDAFEKSRAQSPNLVDAEALLLLTRLLKGDRRDTQFRALADLRRRPIESEDIQVDPAIKYRTYARGLAARGRHRRAKQAYEAVLHTHPQDFRSQFGICLAEMKRLRADAALAACQRVVTEMNPTYAPARQRWAEVAEFLAKPAVVATALSSIHKNGLAGGPDIRRLARALGEQGKLSELEALEKSQDKDAATQNYVKGLLARARGDLSAANAFLSQAAQSLGTDHWAQTAYGDLLLQTGQSTKAIGFFRRAMDLSRAPMGALGLAKAYMQKRDWRAASSTARRAEILAGRSLVRKQMRGEALAVQAQAAAQQGRRGRRKAKSLLRKAKKIDGALPSVALTEGILAEKNRKQDQAITAYRRLTVMAPKDPEGHYRLARILWSDRRSRASARSSLKTVIELDPQGTWGDRARRLLSKR